MMTLSQHSDVKYTLKDKVMAIPSGSAGLSNKAVFSVLVSCFLLTEGCALIICFFPNIG